MSRQGKVGFAVKYKKGKTTKTVYANSREEAKNLAAYLLKTGKADRVWVSPCPETIDQEEASIS